MQTLKMMLCSASDNGGRVLVKGKCPVSAATQTAGAASMGAMMPPSNSLQLLDETFSVSEPASSEIRRP